MKSFLNPFTQNFCAMFQHTSLSLLFLFVLLALFLNLTPPDATVFFQIEPGSKLNIKGTSNVTDFTCKCEEIFPRLQMTLNSFGTKAEFKKTALSLRAKKLDCGNKAMNNDMYETMKAEENPIIQIELLESELAALADSWATVQASANLTIAGVTRKETFSIQAKKADALQFRIKGSKSLKMTDYGMTPPRPMMGLIKVKDLIILDLDLTVSVLEKM